MKKDNIVLIEDNIVFAKSLTRKLEREGFEVKLFTSLSSYSHIEADLYIMDVMLEAKSFDLVKEIRSLTNKPIVMMSTYDEQDFKIQSLTNGADAYFNKLTSPKLFIAEIRAILDMYNRLTNAKNRNL